jgi:hypothetical protein
VIWNVGVVAALAPEGRLFAVDEPNEVSAKKFEIVAVLGMAIDVRVEPITTTAVLIEVDVTAGAIADEGA